MEDLIKELFEKDPYARSLGAELVSSNPLFVHLPVAAGHLNFGGVVHGGVMFSLADIVLSLLSNGEGRAAVATATHIAFTAGAKLGDVLRATGEAVQVGRRAGTYRITITRQDAKVVSAFTGTVMFTGENW